VFELEQRVLMLNARLLRLAMLRHRQVGALQKNSLNRGDCRIHAKVDTVPA